MFRLTSRCENEKIKLRIWKGDGMNLSEKTVENVEYMIEQIKEKLKVLNLGAIKPSHFDEEMYEELKEIYEMVMKKPSFSPNEMQALVEELGNLRKK
jgi:uncharacterized protein YfkK (UPF0435 family)